MGSIFDLSEEQIYYGVVFAIILFGALMKLTLLAMAGVVLLVFKDWILKLRTNENVE